MEKSVKKEPASMPRFCQVHKRMAGCQVVFRCEVCGLAVPVYLRGPVSLETALDQGWAQARSSMSRCRRCGRWHCDACRRLPAMLCAVCAADGP